MPAMIGLGERGEENDRTQRFNLDLWVCIYVVGIIFCGLRVLLSTF